MNSGPLLEGRQLTTVRLSDVGEHGYSELYRTLLEPTFPPPELVTFDELDHARRSDGCDGLVVLDGPRPVAVMVTEDYLEGRVRLLAYLAVGEGWRGRGLGEYLLSTLSESSTLSEDERPLLLAEIEDPRFHAANQASDPPARVRFYARHGCRLLPLDYFQPSLRPGSLRVENLLLITLDPPAEAVDGGLVADFLEEYFEACEGSDASDDDRVQALYDAARGGMGGRLPAYPLADLTYARPDSDITPATG